MPSESWRPGLSENVVVFKSTVSEILAMLGQIRGVNKNNTFVILQIEAWNEYMTSSQPYWVPILFVSSLNVQYDESVIFFDASSQRIFFFNLDPTLSSHNSGSKNYSNKNCQFSESPGRQLSDGIPWMPPLFQSEKKRLRLHSLGPLWTISTGHQWEISEAGRLSCFIDFFVWFYIVCDRYTSDYGHFIFSDIIWLL